MGVPALFRWLSTKYPKIISPVIEKEPEEVDGVKIPIDTRERNPNGEEFDNLYLDMNGIVHPCAHPEDRPAPANEEEMMIEIFKYTERVVNMVRPRKLLMIAVDGVAPRAKMNQQRSRRFRSAQEAKEKDEDKAEFLKMLKSRSDGEVDEDALNKKTWDSNAITPGTPFMDILAKSLRYWIAYKLNTDPAWEKLKIIISDATVPGEGEHKIMEFIRSQRRQPEHDPNTRHVIYGLDADLIMLGLATHEPHFRVLREDVFFQETKTQVCNLCGQPGHRADSCRGEVQKVEKDLTGADRSSLLKPFIWLHVSILREYLAVEMHVPNAPFTFDLERALDDWVFMCFFVGNDFLPHLPSLDIREQGIDTLIAIWRDNLPLMGGYVTKDGHVDLERVQLILAGLAKQEDAIFRRRRQTEERREVNAKRRKLESERSEARRVDYERRNSRNTNDPDQNSTPTQSGSKRRAPLTAADFEHLPSFAPGESRTTEAIQMTHEALVNRNAFSQSALANKSAAAALKEQLLRRNLNVQETPTKNSENGDRDATSSIATPENSGANLTETPPSTLGKRKADALEEDDAGTPGRNTPNIGSSKSNSDQPPEDTVRLWEDGYSDRYYQQKFKRDPNDIEFRHQVGRDYVEGLAWVLLYYFQGCPSWTWYYPHHYAPFAADFVDLDKMTIKFNKGRIFRPYEQLMGVMPAASGHTLPAPFRPLMSDEDSEIIDFYPTEFEIDLNGKKMAWQGVALLPFIDEKRLLDAMAKKYPLLSADEIARNQFGHEALLFSTHHPLYEEVATNFYSKKQATSRYQIDVKVSEGLCGELEKNDSYLPQSSLSFPLTAGRMPDLDEDRSISVNYIMPQSDSVHKSMLLRGVDIPKPVLDSNDISLTRERASKSGRSYGGAPFNRSNSGRGRGRGGRGGGNNGGFNYRSDSRNGPQDHFGNGFNTNNRNPSNPFAAFMDPNFIPGGVPPPPHVAAANGWIPPPPGGYGRGGSGYPPPPGGFGRGGSSYLTPPPTNGHPGQNGGYQGYNGGGQQGYDGYRGGFGGGGYRNDNRGQGGYRNDNRGEGGYRNDNRGQDSYQGRGGRGGYRDDRHYDRY